MAEIYHPGTAMLCLFSWFILRYITQDSDALPIFLVYTGIYHLGTAMHCLFSWFILRYITQEQRCIAYFLGSYWDISHRNSDALPVFLVYIELYQYTVISWIIRFIDLKNKRKKSAPSLLYSPKWQVYSEVNVIPCFKLFVWAYLS